MTNPHHYEPPVAYHYHNTPCKLCGKTARHQIHQVAAEPAPVAEDDQEAR
jgi:hypothetical protein